MDNLMEQEKGLTKVEKVLELPFLFLVASFILYAEIVTSYFYSTPVLKWAADIDQFKQHFGAYIFGLLVFGVIYAVFLPVIEAVVAWVVHKCIGILETSQSQSEANGVWSWFSLEIEADKQQSSYLQSKVMHARERQRKHQQEFRTLSQRAFSVLVIAIANYYFAEAGIVQTARENSVYLTCMIFFYIFVLMSYIFSVIESSKELKIYYKPTDSHSVLVG